MSATPTPNPSCPVTNAVTLPNPALSPQAGWDGSIISLYAFNPDQATATSQVYLQTLEPLPFSNGDSLAVGNTGSLTLNQTRDGEPIVQYDLIFAQPNNLFPVQSVDAMLDLTTLTYPPITVTNPPATATAGATNSNSSTVNAWLFCQAINAYPTSKMALQFASLLTSFDQTSASVSGIETAFSNFFQSYPNYQNVNLDSYVLVSSYLAAYANAWANFADSYTFYLYADASTSAGKVVFTRQTLPGGIASVTDSNGNYTITYYATETDTTGTPLYFSYAMLVSSLTDAVPAICLQCSYHSFAKLTRSKQDKGIIVPFLFGRINNQKVFGINRQAADQPAPTDLEQQSNQDTDTDSSSASSSWNGTTIALTVVGIVASMAIIGAGLNYLWKWYQRRLRMQQLEPLLRLLEPKKGISDDVDISMEDLASSSQALAQENFNRMGNGRAEVYPANSLDQALQIVCDKRLEEDDEFTLIIEEDELNDLSEILSNQAEYGEDEREENEQSDIEDDEVAVRDQIVNPQKGDVKNDQSQANQIGKSEVENAELEGKKLNSQQQLEAKNAQENVEEVDDGIKEDDAKEQQKKDDEDESSDEDA